MEWEDRIVLVPEILAGKPVIKGTRLSVAFIVGLLGQGWTESEILENYKGITRDDIEACCAYAAAALELEQVFPLKA